jgi:hypothetical protein
VLDELALYSTLYETASLAAAQPSNADDTVMLPDVKPDGASHTTAVDLVVNCAEAYPLVPMVPHAALTLHS